MVNKIKIMADKRDSKPRTKSRVQ